MKVLATHALVPLKPLRYAKSRLCPALDTAAREQLVQDMCERVLATLQQVPQLACVWLVSSEPRAPYLAAKYGARHLPDDVGTLNGALQAGITAVARAGGAAVVILPADVPLATPADIHTLLDLLLAAPQRLVIAPGHDLDGTNALAFGLPLPFALQYGSASFQAHTAAARAHGWSVQVVTSTTLALDIDTPADLEQAQRLAQQHATGHTERHEQHEQHEQCEQYEQYERSTSDGNYWLRCGT